MTIEFYPPRLTEDSLHKLTRISLMVYDEHAQKFGRWLTQILANESMRRVYPEAPIEVETIALDTRDWSNKDLGEALAAINALADVPTDKAALELTQKNPPRNLFGRGDTIERTLNHAADQHT